MHRFCVFWTWVFAFLSAIFKILCVFYALGFFGCPRKSRYILLIVPRIAYNCPSEWTYFEESKSCYKVFFWADWQDAENVCIKNSVNNSGHLASIHSETENSFVICKLNYIKY